MDACSTHTSGRGAQLLRSLFPTWRFFEEVTDIPVLRYRTCAAETDFGSWILCPAVPQRRWYSMLVNPAGNFAMACSSLLQLFEAELVDGKPSAVSEELIKALVRYEIRKSYQAPREHFALVPTHFEFSLTHVTQGSAVEAGEVFFHSTRLAL